MRESITFFLKTSLPGSGKRLNATQDIFMKKHKEMCNDSTPETIDACRASIIVDDRSNQPRSTLLPSHSSSVCIHGRSLRTCVQCNQPTKHFNRNQELLRLSWRYSVNTSPNPQANPLTTFQVETMAKAWCLMIWKSEEIEKMAQEQKKVVQNPKKFLALASKNWRRRPRRWLKNPRKPKKYQNDEESSDEGEGASDSNEGEEGEEAWRFWRILWRRRRRWRWRRRRNRRCGEGEAGEPTEKKAEMERREIERRERSTIPPKTKVRWRRWRNEADWSGETWCTSAKTNLTALKRTMQPPRTLMEWSLMREKSCWCFSHNPRIDWPCRWKHWPISQPHDDYTKIHKTQITTLTNELKRLLKETTRTMSHYLKGIALTPRESSCELGSNCIFRKRNEAKEAESQCFDSHWCFRFNGGRCVRWPSNERISGVVLTEVMDKLGRECWSRWFHLSLEGHINLRPKVHEGTGEQHHKGRLRLCLSLVLPTRTGYAVHRAWPPWAIWRGRECCSLSPILNPPRPSPSRMTEEQHLIHAAQRTSNVDCSPSVLTEWTPPSIIQTMRLRDARNLAKAVIPRLEEDTSPNFAEFRTKRMKERQIQMKSDYKNGSVLLEQATSGRLWTGHACWWKLHQWNENLEKSLRT